MENKKISLKEYAPVINEAVIGDEILKIIRQCDPENNIVHIDMQGIVSMTTFCAKQIFGTLFKDLGEKKYGTNIKPESTTSDIDLIISLGIDSVRQ